MKKIIVILVLTLFSSCATVHQVGTVNPTLNRYKIELTDGNYRELNGYCCQIDNDTLYIVDENGKIMVHKGWKSFQEVKGNSTSNIVYEDYKNDKTTN